MIWIDVARDGLLDAEQFGVDEAASYAKLEQEIQRVVKAEYPEEAVLVSIVGIEDYWNLSWHLQPGDINYIHDLAYGVIAQGDWVVYE